MLTKRVPNPSFRQWQTQASQQSLRRWSSSSRSRSIHQQSQLLLCLSPLTPGARPSRFRTCNNPATPQGPCPCTTSNHYKQGIRRLATPLVTRMVHLPPLNISRAPLEGRIFLLRAAHRVLTIIIATIHLAADTVVATAIAMGIIAFLTVDTAPTATQNTTIAIGVNKLHLFRATWSSRSRRRCSGPQ